MTYIGGEGKEATMFVVKLINAVLNYLVETFFQGAAPQPVLVPVKVKK